MRGCILGEFEFIAIQNLSMFNPRLERGEIRRGKVAARVNFVALRNCSLFFFTGAFAVIRVFISTIFRWRAGYANVCFPP